MTPFDLEPTMPFDRLAYTTAALALAAPTPEAAPEVQGGDCDGTPHFEDVPPGCDDAGDWEYPDTGDTTGPGDTAPEVPHAR